MFLWNVEASPQESLFGVRITEITGVEDEGGVSEELPHSSDWVFYDPEDWVRFCNYNQTGGEDGYVFEGSSVRVFLFPVLGSADREVGAGWSGQNSIHIFGRNVGTDVVGRKCNESDIIASLFIGVAP